jgi:hypothetical protein
MELLQLFWMIRWGIFKWPQVGDFGWPSGIVIIPPLKEKIDNPQTLLDYYNKKSDLAVKAFEELDKELKEEQLNRKELKEQINILKGTLSTGLSNMGFFTNPEVRKALNNKYLN